MKQATMWRNHMFIILSVGLSLLELEFSPSTAKKRTGNEFTGAESIQRNGLRNPLDQPGGPGESPIRVKTQHQSGDGF